MHQSIIISIWLTMVSASAATAQLPAEVSASAQSDMHKRISTATTAYADRISLDRSFVYYCNTKLNLQYHGQPTDGMIPYGINYYNLKTKAELDQVISAREIFERSYLLVCLAETKAAFRGAEQH